MAIKKFKPTSDGRRFMTISAFEEITKGKPEKKLVESLKNFAGRNNTGRITMRHRGGGAKRKPPVKAKGKKKPEPERATATEHLQFLADAVNGDRFLPQTMITMSKARELIRAGLVTEQRMRERGVHF